MKNNFLNWAKNNIEWLLVVFAILAIVSPLLFTRPWTGVDFTTTGQIGDTIGGLTAPILNFLTIVLLYLALKEQIEANKIQKDNENTRRDYDIIFTQFANIKQEFENIKLSILAEHGEVTYTGTRAIFEYKNILENCTNITDCISEYSVRAFGLSYTYMTSNLFFLLHRNYSSNLSKQDKESIYTTLVQMRTPLLMTSLVSAQYGQKKKSGQTEVDKVVIMQSLLAGQFKTEFDKHNPANLT